MIQKTYRLWVAGLVTLCSAPAVAQQKVEMFSFGNMDLDVLFFQGLLGIWISG